MDGGDVEDNRGRGVGAAGQLLAAADAWLFVTTAARYAAVQRLRDTWDVPRWVALARLPLQVPLVLWGLQVAGKLPSTGRRA